MSKKKEIKKLKKEIKELQEVIEILIKQQAGFEYDLEQVEKACKRDFKHERDVRNVIIRRVNKNTEEIAKLNGWVEAEVIKEEKGDKL